MIKDFDKFITENFGMDVPMTEKDSDSNMALGQLKRTKDFAEMLIPIVSGMDDMEPWVQSKITKAEDYLNAVLNYYKGQEGISEASTSQIKNAYNNIDKILGDDMQMDFLDIQDNGTWEDMVDFISQSADEDKLRKYGIKSIKDLMDLSKYIVGESVTEAARVGRGSWSSVLRDLKSDGWEVKGNSAYKSYDSDEGDERKLELSNRGGDEVEWTIYDGRDKEINSDSFDAEGMSAGELDGEVWNNIYESVNEAKVTKKSVSKASDDLAKIIIQLKDNLALLQTAKSDEDRAKYIQIAKDLTQQRKDASAALDLAIAKLDKNAELQVED